MTDLQVLDRIAGQLIPEQELAKGKWFGKPCLKMGGKVFTVLWNTDLVFKLTGEAHSEALQIAGSHLFDPRGKGYPMREWVQIPRAQASTWSRFARLACEYVAGVSQAKKDEVISGLIEVRRMLLDSVCLLSPEKHDAVFLGEWTIKDLLAHLVGWDYTNLESVQEIIAGQKPGFLDHYDLDWKTYNTQLVEEYRCDDFAKLVSTVQASHQKLIEYLQSVSAEEYVKRTKNVSLLRTETDDEKTHYGQVEEFRLSDT